MTQPNELLPVTQEDPFHGDDAALCRAIDALLNMDADGVLVPHGIGGHARSLLAAARHRLSPSGVAASALADELERRPVRTEILNVETGETGIQDITVPLDLRDRILAALKTASPASEASERFLTAYVSQDAKIIGIEHETEADWGEVHRAHEALRDRLNERLVEREQCPFKPTALPSPPDEAMVERVAASALGDELERDLALLDRKMIAPKGTTPRFYANVRKAIAALKTASPSPSDVDQRLRDLLKAAYTAGANDVHLHLSGKEVEREADFTEAASDYADFALSALQGEDG